VIASPPVIRQVVVELRPGGLGVISTLTGADVAGRVLPADEVMADAATVVADIRAAPTPSDALDRACAMLVGLGAGWRPDPVVEAALHALEDKDRPIGELVAGLPVSHRTVIARFRRATGLTPRDYAQLWRFHRFVTGLALGSESRDWASLAPLGGYYDQAHVVRAFRRFSGWTPSEYRRRVAEFGPAAASFVPLDDVPSAP
jgi:transcriptional regulator GlxA family with amidase domain